MLSRMQISRCCCAEGLCDGLSYNDLFNTENPRWSWEAGFGSNTYLYTGGEILVSNPLGDPFRYARCAYYSGQTTLEWRIKGRMGDRDIPAGLSLRVNDDYNFALWNPFGAAVSTVIGGVVSGGPEGSGTYQILAVRWFDSPLFSGVITIPMSPRLSEDLFYVPPSPLDFDIGLKITRTAIGPPAVWTAEAKWFNVTQHTQTDTELDMANAYSDLGGLHFFHGITLPDDNRPGTVAFTEFDYTSS